MIHDSAAFHCLSDLILHWRNLITYASLTTQPQEEPS